MYSFVIILCIVLSALVGSSSLLAFPLSNASFLVLSSPNFVVVLVIVFFIVLFTSFLCVYLTVILRTQVACELLADQVSLICDKSE